MGLVGIVSVWYTVVLLSAKVRFSGILLVVWPGSKYLAMSATFLVLCGVFLVVFDFHGFS